MKHLFPFFIILLCISGCTTKKPIKTGLEGKPLPSFNLLLIDSMTHLNTSAIPMGKSTIFYYYSPFCPFCKAQMQNIIENISSFHDIQIFAITPWPFAEMRKFYRHYQLNKYPNIIVGHDLSNSFGIYYNIQGVPFTTIFDKGKRLREAFIGNVDGKQLKQDVAD